MEMFMEKLIEFIEANVIEESLYWQICQIYERTEVVYEIRWVKEDEKPWQLRNKDSIEQWKCYKGANLTEALNSHKISLPDFEHKLKTTILQNAVFANTILQKTKELLGEDAISKAIEDNEIFLHNLKKIIETLLIQDESIADDDLFLDDEDDLMFNDKKDFRPNLRLIRD